MHEKNEKDFSMKVLFFANTPVSNNDIKGTGNWITSLLENIKSSDSDLEVYVAFHDKKSRKIVYGLEKNIHVVKIPQRSHTNLANKLLNKWLLIDFYKNIDTAYLEIIDSIQPDVIQIFGLESPFIRILGKVKIPVIVHIQGLYGPYIFKYFSRFSNLEMIIAKGIGSFVMGNSPFLKKKTIQKHLELEKSVYNHIQYFLGRTEWDRRCALAIAPQASYFYCQEVMRPIFYLTKWEEPKEKKPFIIYTTISDAFYKNVDMIFYTCSLLERYHNYFTFEWRVGGVSENSMTSKIMRKKVRVKGLKLLGNLDSGQIVNEMLKAHLYVYPSAIENGCNAVQEAMLVGMPIISTNSGGLSTTINDKKTGILVQEGDPYALAGAIIEIHNNYGIAKKFGDEARFIAHKRHNPKTIVENLKKIYCEIVKQ